MPNWVTDAALTAPLKATVLSKDIRSHALHLFFDFFWRQVHIAISGDLGYNSIVNFKPGDRVVVANETRSFLNNKVEAGEKGTITPDDFAGPGYVHVQFDDGGDGWIPEKDLNRDGE